MIDINDDFLQAERYHLIRAAASSGEWSKLRELTSGMEDYQDVAQLIDLPRRIGKKAAEAYARSEWAEVLRLARLIESEESQIQLRFINDAWNKLPIDTITLPGRREDNRHWGTHSTAISKDGKQLAAGSHDGTITLWEVDSQEPIHIFDCGKASPVYQLALLPNGQRLLSSSSDGRLILWDLATKQQVLNMLEPEKHHHSLDITPDNRLAISGTSSGMLRCWDLRTGLQLRTYNGHQGWVSGVKVSLDGKTLFTAAANEDRMRLWDINSGLQIGEIKVHLSPANALAITPDGKQIISTSSNGRIISWDIESGTELRTFSVPTESDGSLLAWDKKRNRLTHNALLWLRALLLPES